MWAVYLECCCLERGLDSWGGRDSLGRGRESRSSYLTRAERESKLPACESHMILILPQHLMTPRLSSVFMKSVQEKISTNIRQLPPGGKQTEKSAESRARRPRCVSEFCLFLIMEIRKPFFFSTSICKLGMCFLITRCFKEAADIEGSLLNRNADDPEHCL